MEKIKTFKSIPQFTRNPNYRVNIPTDYLLETLEHHVVKHNLDINPDFQRGHVWDEEKQIKYIEYFFRGGLSGRDIYFNHPDWMRFRRKSDVMVLVDGKQRLEAMRRFLQNEIPLFGTLYKDFEDTIGFNHNDFVFHVNDLPTRNQVLQWYLDLNTGGVVHTDEEIEKVKELMKKD